MQRAIARAGNEDLNNVLTCLRDIDRSEAPARIPDQSDLSKTVRQVILKHLRLPREEAVQ